MAADTSTRFGDSCQAPAAGSEKVHFSFIMHYSQVACVSAYSSWACSSNHNFEHQLVVDIKFKATSGVFMTLVETGQHTPHDIRAVEFLIGSPTVLRYSRDQSELNYTYPNETRMTSATVSPFSILICVAFPTLFVVNDLTTSGCSLRWQRRCALLKTG